MTTVAAIIKEDTGIYSEYFQLTKEYQYKYGNSTILLMQVGAFFEVYALKNIQTGDITDSEIISFSTICNLNISEKKIVYNNKQVLMAGFRDYTLEKYLQKITENHYTAVVYVQEKNEKNTKRIFNSVYSAGTYVSYDNDSSPQMTNNIMCIWFDTYKTLNSNKETLLYGVAVVNILTGKSSIFEYETPYIINPTTFDELERSLCTYSPSEIIIVSPFDKQVLNTIIQYSGIKTPSIHMIDVNDPKTNAHKCTTQKYIKHILTSFYGEDTFQICSEFNTHVIATQSFCFLLHFIQEYNPHLVRKIALPTFTNTSDRMLLVNHTLKQLNIVDDHSVDGKKIGQLSSVLSFTNKCCCSMGRRRFQIQIMNPTFNEEWLNTEYRMIENLLYTPIIDSSRKWISQIRDIEKICRNLVLQKIYPSSIYHLYNSIGIIKELNYSIRSSSTEIYTYLCSDFIQNAQHKDFIDKTCGELTQFIDSHLIMDKSSRITSMNNYDESFIQPGVCPILDGFISKQTENLQLFYSIQEHLNQLMKPVGKPNDDMQYVKEHETDKSGLSLQITKTRGNALKKILSSSPGPYLKITDNVVILISDIQFKNASASNDEIVCPLLSKISRDILLLKSHINDQLTVVYLSFIKELEQNWMDRLENLATYVSKFDVLQSKAYIAREYKYCKPTIVSDAEKSFVDVTALRHVLIEHIQQNEIYVSNDMTIGNKNNQLDGILLYGTNAVGKTSMIRALGIAVVMAQCGMYVPCSQFLYKPYTAIFSRILGNDNIFKGLSTFAVEMSELRIILKLADKNSLILGDELCSGTETESALSIFMAGLMDLHAKECSFIFATHFHEIVHNEEITGLKRLVMKHLSVYYDRSLDCLVYDRKLKNGSGTRMYGLEVCKSLHLPDEFLEKAYSLRNKYYPETKGELGFEPTVYNAKKIRGVCEMCKTHIGEEVHHLQQQKDADANGFIDHFHKNHPANLMNICEKCHDKIHKEPSVIESELPAPKKKIVRKKTTKGYAIVETDAK